MNDNIKEILPIGSVVTLNVMKEEYSKTKFIIVNRFVLNPEDKSKYFEYEVLVYPAGTKDGKKIFTNREQIKDEIFRGYTDAIDQEYIIKAEEHIRNSNLVKTM